MVTVCPLALGKWRMRHPALHTGELTQFVPEEGVYVFFRYNATETIMVIMNTNDAEYELKTARFAEMLEGFVSAREPIVGETYNDLSKLKLQPQSTTILELVR